MAGEKYNHSIPDSGEKWLFDKDMMISEGVKKSAENSHGLGVPPLPYRIFSDVEAGVHHLGLPLQPENPEYRPEYRDDDHFTA
ncbi:MAG: hypothetical protein WCJ84_04120 [Candidatus Peregrinibacteria bacterium]